MAGPIRIAILANAAQARREIRQFSRDLNDIKRVLKPIESVSSAVTDFARGASKATLITTGLTAAVASVGAASGPLLALGGGVAGSMGAAGIGVAAFAALAVPSFAKVASGVEGVTKAQEAYDAAVAAGDSEGANRALEARAAALARLNPVQREAVLSTIAMKDAFSKASEQFANPAIRTYTKGVETLKNLIPTLITIATPVQTALIGQFERLFASLESPAFDKFAGRLANYVGPIIETTGDLVADLGMTIGHLIDQSLPVANQMLSIFGSLFSELREASASSGLGQFFQDMVPLASKLADFISALVGAVGDLIVATIPLGGPLLSMLEKLSGSLSKLFQSEQFARFATALGAAFAALSPVLDTLLQAVGSVAAGIAEALGPTITALTPFVSQFAETFVAVVDAVAPLLPIIGEVIASLGAALLPVFKQLIPVIAEQFAPVIRQLADEILPQVAPHFQTIVEAVIPLIPEIANLAAQILPLIPIVVGAVAALLDFSTKSGEAQNTIQTLAGIVKGAVTVIKGALDIIVGFMTGDWGRVWDGAKTVVTGWGETVGSVISGVSTRFQPVIGGALAGVQRTWSAAWSAVSSVTSQAWQRIGQAVSAGVTALVGVVRRIPGALASVFASAGTWLWNAGVRIIQGLINGIDRMISAVRTRLQQLTNMIPAWKGPADRDARLLFRAGELIIGSLVRGFDAAENDVIQKLAQLTQRIQGGMNGIVAPNLTPEFSLSTYSALSQGSSGGGGNTYQLTVNVPVGASPADVGREIVRHIEAFEAAGGRRRAG